jgi:hypothetical protein
MGEVAANTPLDEVLAGILGASPWRGRAGRCLFGAAHRFGNKADAVQPRLVG